MRVDQMINKKNKNGSWTLCGNYLAYREEGGVMSPIAWNFRQAELLKESRKSRNVEATTNKRQRVRLMQMNALESILTKGPVNALLVTINGNTVFFENFDRREMIGWDMTLMDEITIKTMDLVGIIYDA